MPIFNTNRWNRLRYTCWAPIYDWFVGMFHRKRRRSFDLVAIQPGERVLLVGAGTGLDLEFIPCEVQVTAIDLTPGMLNRLRRKADRQNRTITAEVMDAQQMTLADASFDVAVLHLILAVIPDPRRCLAEVERVLRPGGRAVILDKFAPDDRAVPWYLRLLNPLASFIATHVNRRLRDILAGSRLVVVTDQAAGLRGFFRHVLLRRPET